MPFDHPRAEWHPTGAAVLDSDGDPRPRLATPLDVFTVHWTGAGAWADLGDSADEARSVERFAVSAKKPNEYNSITDSASETWEYAGPFRAAHSAGENETAWGNLVLVGPLDEPIPPDVMLRYVHGIRRMRWNLVQLGYLTPGHHVIPHRNMPGAATTCPGPLADDPAVWAAIAAPLDGNPDTPPPQEDDDMRPICFVRFQNYTWVAWPGHFKTWPGSPEAADHLKARYPDTPIVKLGDTKADVEMFRSYGRVEGVLPPGGSHSRDRWGILREVG